MAVVIDTVTGKRPRHPEKQNRPDTPLLKKPEWLRVRAPGAAGYNATRQVALAGPGKPGGGFNAGGGDSDEDKGGNGGACGEKS